MVFSYLRVLEAIDDLQFSLAKAISLNGDRFFV